MTDFYTESEGDPSARAVSLTGTRMPLPDDLPPLRAVIVAPQALGLPASMPNPEDRPVTRESFGDQTERALNAIIEDCHFLMREVAYRGMVHAADTGERLAFLKTALKCAETGASTAKAVARLRAFPLDDDRQNAILLEMERLLERQRAKKKEANPENE